MPLTNPNPTWSPSVQRIVRIAAGQTIASTVFPDDVGGLQFELATVFVASQLRRAVTQG